MHAESRLVDHAGKLDVQAPGLARRGVVEEVLLELVEDQEEVAAALGPRLERLDDGPAAPRLERLAPERLDRCKAQVLHQRRQRVVDPQAEDGHRERGRPGRLAGGEPRRGVAQDAPAQLALDAGEQHRALADAALPVEDRQP